ncbi:MAG: hypothetical protein COU47_03710 [Candidatus Niyogibacteria bacterium CG10_big_fil_rev_8_21_14_0_10_46_36]|uniref:Uncharacterized protein n=1 Tax=Candidatus Niyogibacteria bacterium CG10_big_fil_rev_8_21_14_0_10_46_36 TaxID=1974726 RepID=A0A2H0TDZ3_9BACT|nr:MAG: hypothetical protein COU47_03710 [Candidatus Niyogibacteria bacterium CG10_big_fil_rev_8_21_14_0_10_46_36]
MNKKKKVKTLKTPNNALVNKYFKKYEKDERYFVADKALEELFDAFPKNSDFKNVLLKVSALNALYSTSVYAIFKMAEHIHSLKKIDQSLKNGDIKIVDKIAKVDFADRIFYSFATKYSHWHNPEEYPIYDQFVDKVLWGYQQQNKFSDFRRSDLKQFREFKRVLNEFRKHYKLSGSLKEIDKFLWIYGKELFDIKPKNKKRSKSVKLVKIK